MNDVNRRLRELPHLEAVLSSATGIQLQQQYQRTVVVGQARELISEIRGGLLAGSYAGPTDEQSVAAMLKHRLERLCAPAVKPVVNATGILLHTNLGRAPFTVQTQRAITEVANGYSSLEFDLDTGKRGKRDKQLARQLAALFGCEDATVVNNCAAAMMIALNTMAREREVITSRGELVEIGGSYRVPDVIPASGCRLREVGTTNRTRAADYEKAITEYTGLILKTHASNYRIRGFTEEASVAELVEIGSRYAVPVLVDLGSGYLRQQGLGKLDEPEVQETLAAGPDIVCISGDKLLGGPQAGILLGSREWIDRIRKNALWRVLRLDKLCIAALSSTITQYLQNSSQSAVSLLATQLDRKLEDLEALAGALAAGIRQARPTWSIEVVAGTASVGGGSLPDQDYESRAVAIVPDDRSAEVLEAELRHVSTPVIGYVSQGRLLLDVASLLEGDSDSILAMFGELDG
ncbi:L-seryl-tRNA(Sec) selenium transferase [bacterium]|nr:L-seryl-tRNA(Sec) selenium transferase [bacterium]